MGATIKLFFFFFCFSTVSCSVEHSKKEPISSSEAFILAKNKIKKHEDLLEINADLLPELQITIEQDRFKFDVEDEKQNIWLVVSVSFQGEVNVSTLTMTEKGERVERAREISVEDDDVNGLTII